MGTLAFKNLKKLFIGRNKNQVLSAFRTGMGFYLRRSTKPHHPVAVTLGITDRCNLNCEMCPINDPRLSEHPDMSFNDFKRVINGLESVLKLEFTGHPFGEPLLNRDFFRMLEYGKGKHMYVELATNGMLIDRRCAERLLESNLDAIYFSLGGATKETHEKIRRGSNFELLIENICQLVRLRNDANKKLHIGILVTLMKKNFRELNMTIDLAKGIGVNNLDFNVVEHRLDIGTSRKDNSLKCFDRTYINNLFKKASTYASEKGINILLPPPELLDTPLKKPYCTRPFFGIVIGTDGTAYPCCRVYDVEVGNVFKDKVLGIWNNDKYVKWREDMLSNPPEQCVECSNYYPYTV